VDIAQENLSGKTILEVGSGRGGTTRKLVDLLLGQPDATLIVTDISDKHFSKLREKFKDKNLQIRFIRTGACELDGIENNSIDYLVCNYTLCAVNSKPGLVTLALRRFWEVLKSGGQLFIEEEFPISKTDTPAQEIWSEKWRILKSLEILTGEFPYTEFSPDTLSGLCRLVGFKDVRWTADTEMFKGAEVLAFFQKRLDTILPRLPNNHLQAGFAQIASNLQEKAVRTGGMEIPYYRLTARK